MEVEMRWLMTTLALCCAAGCTDEDPGPPRIEANVSYGGSARGALTVAAFSSMPPMGAPRAFAQKSVPSFPETVVIDQVEAAETLYVLALIDVSPASPQQPGPEDRTAWSAAVTIAAEGATVVDLTITDP
jgi:hypothetical protein